MSSVVFNTAQPAVSSYVLISNQSKLGSMYAGRINSSGKPLAGVTKFVNTLGYPAVPVVVNPMPYNTFLILSDGVLTTPHGVPETIVGPAPGTSYYNSNGTTIVPTVQVPTNVPTQPPTSLGDQ